MDGANEGLTKVVVVEGATVNRGMAETMAKIVEVIETVMIVEGNANKAMKRTEKTTKAIRKRKRSANLEKTNVTTV